MWRSSAPIAGFWGTSESALSACTDAATPKFLRALSRQYGFGQFRAPQGICREILHILGPFHQSALPKLGGNPPNPANEFPVLDDHGYPQLLQGRRGENGHPGLWDEWRWKPVPCPRRNDPAGVSDNPNVVTDPVRVAKRVAEFRRCLTYLEQSYRAEKRLGFGVDDFNESLVRLKRAVGRPRDPSVPETRISPWLEFAINIRARELAGLEPKAPLKDEHDRFVQMAAKEVAARAKAVRGPNGDRMLRRYVEALMALCQEFTGRPVMAMRHKDSVYEPQLVGAGGNVIRLIVDLLEPGVIETRLVNWVCAARRKYAGKRMRFHDFFPGYGATVRDGGMPTAPAPYQLKLEAISQPIFCP